MSEPDRVNVQFFSSPIIKDWLSAFGKQEEDTITHCFYLGSA